MVCTMFLAHSHMMTTMASMEMPKPGHLAMALVRGETGRLLG